MSIIDRIVEAVFSVLGNLLDMLPTIVSYLPGAYEFTGFTDLLLQASFFLPLPTMLLCLTIITVTHAAMNSFWVVNWVIKRIRGG